MTTVKVIANGSSGIYEKFRCKGNFPAVSQPIPGTGCTSLPVYLPYTVVYGKYSVFRKKNYVGHANKLNYTSGVNPRCRCQLKVNRHAIRIYKLFH